MDNYLFNFHNNLIILQLMEDNLEGMNDKMVIVDKMEGVEVHNHQKGQEAIVAVL